MAAQKVVTLEDSAYSSYPNTVYIDDAGITKVVNIWSHPTAVWELLQVIGGLMVAANEYGQHWCYQLATVVSLKINGLPPDPQAVETLLTCKRSTYPGTSLVQPSSANPPDSGWTENRHSTITSRSWCRQPFRCPLWCRIFVPARHVHILRQLFSWLIKVSYYFINKTWL